MYQVYRLVRMINATYPNNGFINALDVDENTELSEDLIDVINEALHESYKEVELDEVYSFRTIPFQAEYSLPEDCDMSQIQEVTRSFPYPHSHCWKGKKHGEKIPNPENDDVVLPDDEEADFTIGTEEENYSLATASEETTEEITKEEVNYYDGGLYAKDHYKELPEGVGEHYYNQIHRCNPHIGRARRLVFARDAECLTGDRYYNAWDSGRIGISPTPKTGREVITVYYKKKPQDIRTMDDDIQIKDKFIPILKYNVCAKLAMMGNNPDIDMYNIFTRQYNELLLEARRQKDSDLPFYPHTKDNERPSTYYRRRPRRFRR